MGTMVRDLFNLKNKNIIVAGGAGQIGFAFCEILADAGARVAILDIDIKMASEKLDNVSNEVIRNNISVFKTDVTNQENIISVVKSVRKELGPLYGLVNSFHFKGNTRKLDTDSKFFAPIEDYPVEAWDMVHDVNLRGTFLMTQACGPYFKENNIGVIVNISSTYGIVSANRSIYGDSGINSPVAYATSKAAIINFTRYIATHWAENNIRVNTLSPGGVYNNQSEQFVEKYLDHTPLGRMATANDYQGAILYLLSDASAYMTGANLVVDGGWTAW